METAVLLVGGHLFTTEPEAAFDRGLFSVQGQIVDRISEAQLAFYNEGLTRPDLQPMGRVLSPAFDFTPAEYHKLLAYTDTHIY